MPNVNERSGCSAPVFERSLLSQDQLVRWQGLPLAWLETTPHRIQADLVAERPGIVMIDTGANAVDFHYGSRAKSYEFTPGSIGFFARGSELKRTCWRWNYTRRIYVSLEMASPSHESLFATLPELPGETDIEFRDPDLSSVLRVMVNEVAAGSPRGVLFAESLSLGIAMRLHQRKPQPHYGDRERGALSARQARKVLELIDASGTKDLSLGVLAASAGFSPAQFVRLFKRTFACTPYQYVLNVRLARAKQLVLDGETPLALVAREVGFASQSHMTGAFVRAFKTTPGEMRRAAKHKHQSAQDCGGYDELFANQ